MRIAVIGAGIGGLVVAAGLQSGGHEVALYERRDEPGAIGAGLTLFGNAFAALDAVGLGNVVRGVSGDMFGRLRSGQRTPSGSWLVSVPPSEATTARSLHRADLHAALVAELDRGTLHPNSRALVSAEGEPEVSVDGRTERFDLVVGADGIRSEARRTWGLDPGVRYAGYTAWRGVTAPAEVLSDEVRQATSETWGRGARFGIVPLPDRRVYWFATLSTPAGAAFEDQHRVLCDRFGSWHRPIDDLLASTPPEAVLRHDIYDLAAMPTRFVTGRGVLLGDAAHAMTPDLGQGAGQAIEDAATLVVLLRRVRDSGPVLDRALAEYDAVRRRRTTALWRQSRLTGMIAQQAHPVAVAIRNALMRATPSALMVHTATRLQRWSPPESVDEI
ncbi:2-polyprenyl-6-methoxyphenol hydroxylase-like FAD-dependent oxidoreductase [Stackebrandtia endophytica]|uniref:2-polyprenyl-6-methoxyphenol hydroxylase-like FAD-dependent oxidoreductase n=1 Tax=Stackebrandtia endophytica TaxID=1496996 RepID=A0A543ASW1_9ACTN|nr:FAD-dependent monooxygenase [Stackebrandtia endophytica]TQL75575.1 2-polyprenyl-6-methoxyphenol hydroxylase-like FAD-dependent oxidoreductase [Stackebrandtia endophytica]